MHGRSSPSISLISSTICWMWWIDMDSWIALKDPTRIYHLSIAPQLGRAASRHTFGSRESWRITILREIELNGTCSNRGTQFQVKWYTNLKMRSWSRVVHYWSNFGGKRIGRRCGSIVVCRLVLTICLLYCVYTLSMSQTRVRVLLSRQTFCVFINSSILPLS